MDGPQRRSSVEDALRLCKFPKRHREARNGLSWTSGQKSVMRSAHDSVRRGAISAIVGGRGRGKTQMATEVAYWLVRQHGFSARYSTFGDLIASYRQWCYTESKPEAGWFSNYAHARCLVIDELGERRDTEDESLFLTRVMDYRYRNIIGTIIISNAKPDELGKSIGASAVDRLREGGQVLVCDWPSFRGGAT